MVDAEGRSLGVSSMVVRGACPSVLSVPQSRFWSVPCDASWLSPKTPWTLPSPSPGDKDKKILTWALFTSLSDDHITLMSFDTSNILLCKYSYCGEPASMSSGFRP